MNLEQARSNMIEQQIRTWEVLDQAVLDLLYTVPREDFVPPAYRNLAFTDMEIPLGKHAAEGQKMWSPKMEARILQELGVKKTDRVLEIGTGSGYLTALLAHRAAQVISVEIDPALAALGRANLERHGLDNVSLEIGDGARDHGKWGPYDIVVLTGSVPVLPEAMLASLAPGGRAFAVVGDAPVMTAQLITCTAPGAWRSEGLFETLLAPLANCLQPSRFRF
ncbi:MAG: protein-L-isoaspartate O-methyltransferase [Betaproteobacteria bacterium]|nr:protein-L-isoaspartate O-methyltransferase [Betaproteobacteria bacterium]MSQ87885.1 protein-L-isoaspartate O-methyltransferase [Betaproteobacteria bacterium]